MFSTTPEQPKKPVIIMRHHRSKMMHKIKKCLVVRIE
jgi:hypothetical protein